MTSDDVHRKLRPDFAALSDRGCHWSFMVSRSFVYVPSPTGVEDLNARQNHRYWSLGQLITRNVVA